MNSQRRPTISRALNRHHDASFVKFDESGYPFFDAFRGKPSTEGLESRLKHAYDWYKIEKNLRKK